MLEPLIANRHRPIGGGKNDVEETLRSEHFAQPALVLDVDAITKILKMRENAWAIACLQKMSRSLVLRELPV